MENIILKLKSGVTLIEQNGVTGLSLAGHVRLAKDAQQADLIQALGAHEQTLEELQKPLRTLNATPAVDADMALALAAFILDFEYYIKS
jgi:hypothetical protein